MKRILLTGSTGFIGRNIAPLLRRTYEVFSPDRNELDLLDSEAVRSYIAREQFDAIIHLGNPTAQNPLDPLDELFERSMRVFSSLEYCAGLYGKMIYLGSGAEYGKHRAIAASEDNFGEALPRDSYGLSRHLMSRIAATHENIVNLRLFGCYGPHDPPYKLMQHIIACIREGKVIDLNRDAWFDFLYVEDIFPILVHFIENNPKIRVYNLCSGERVKISSVAEEIMFQMKVNLPIVFKLDGMGLEYTGSNSRLLNEAPYWKPRSLREGIKKVLECENKQWI